MKTEKKLLYLLLAQFLLSFTGVISANELSLDKRIDFLFKYSEEHGTFPYEMFPKDENDIKQLRQRADEGDLKCNFLLGELFIRNKSYDSAISYLTNSAIQGHLMSQYKLGVAYSHIVNKNPFYSYFSFYWLYLAKKNGYNDKSMLMYNIDFGTGKLASKDAKVRDSLADLLFLYSKKAMIDYFIQANNSAAEVSKQGIAELEALKIESQGMGLDKNQQERYKKVMNSLKSSEAYIERIDSLKAFVTRDIDLKSKNEKLISNIEAIGDLNKKQNDIAQNIIERLGSKAVSPKRTMTEDDNIVVTSKGFSTPNGLLPNNPTKQDLIDIFGEARILGSMFEGDETVTYDFMEVGIVAYFDKYSADPTQKPYALSISFHTYCSNCNKRKLSTDGFTFSANSEVTPIKVLKTFPQPAVKALRGRFAIKDEAFRRSYYVIISPKHEADDPDVIESVTIAFDDHPYMNLLQKQVTKEQEEEAALKLAALASTPPPSAEQIDRKRLTKHYELYAQTRRNKSFTTDIYWKIRPLRLKEPKDRVYSYRDGSRLRESLIKTSGSLTEPVVFFEKDTGFVVIGASSVPKAYRADGDLMNYFKLSENTKAIYRKYDTTFGHFEVFDLVAERYPSLFAHPFDFADHLIRRFELSDYVDSIIKHPEPESE